MPTESSIEQLTPVRILVSSIPSCVFLTFLLMQTKSQDEPRATTADLVCKERMPTPDAIDCPPSPEIIRIPVVYPWKRTYCGSELVYSACVSSPESPVGEQSPGGAAGEVEAASGTYLTPRAACDDEECEKAEWVTVDKNDQRSLTESVDAGSDSAKIGRTGSDSPKIGRTGSDSPKFGRTGSAPDAAAEAADKFILLPDAKLVPFSPPRTQTNVREDSVPPEENPAKRVRFEKEDADSHAA
jgi:hypothetical protein